MSSQNNNIPEGFKMTELGLLPEEWKVVRLRDNSHFNTLPSGIRFFTETKKYLSTSSIQGSKIKSPECLITYNDRPSRANMQPALGTVWFAKMIGTVKVYGFTKRNNHEINEYILSTGFCGILCKDDVDPEYMKFIFLSDFFNNVKDSLCSGTTQRAINSENIGSIQIPLPLLSEQKSIARILSTIQKAIETQDKIIVAAKELKKSLMRHLFIYGPVPVSEAENVPLKETEIGPLPEHWEVVKLGNVCKISTGTTPSTENKDYYKGSVPFIKTTEIVNNVIREAQTFVSEQAVNDYNLKIYKPGTVFLAMYGQGKTRGQVAILNIEATTTQNTAAIQPTGNLDGKHLWMYLMSQYEALRGAGHHGQISHLNLGYVKQIQVPIPPNQEQKEIVVMLSIVNKKIEVEENRKVSLQALFKTVLRNLVTGKVRVNHLEAEVS